MIARGAFLVGLSNLVRLPPQVVGDVGDTIVASRENGVASAASAGNTHTVPRER